MVLQSSAIGYGLKIIFALTNLVLHFLLFIFFARVVQHSLQKNKQQI